MKAHEIFVYGAISRKSFSFIFFTVSIALIVQIVQGAIHTTDKEFTIRHNTIVAQPHFMEKYGSLFESPPVAEIFVTRGDTEDTYPLHPDGSGDIIITEEMLHNGTQYNHVVLACNSSYPVEWAYENGDGVS